jgi:hypothetical protein
MDYKIHIEDKQFVYVISNEDLPHDITVTDISIFEVDEWNDLLSKRELFKKWETILTHSSDAEYKSTPTDLRDAAYYLYYKENFCGHSDLSALEYSTGNKQDIHERVFTEAEHCDNGYVSVNKFRRRICDNYETLMKNYNILKMYDDK